MPTVFNIALPVPMHRIFDYLPPEGLEVEGIQPGVRIEVPFGRSRKIGILLSVKDSSDIPQERLRASLSILDSVPLLGPEDLALLTWTSRYYHHPLGETLFSAMAVSLRKGGESLPTQEQRLLLSRQPEGTDFSKKAPRQSALLEHLHQAGRSLSRNELVAAHPQYPAAAKALVKKGLAIWQTVITEHGQHPPLPRPQAPPELNDHQTAAVTYISARLDTFHVFLLEGVTGSGKTEVYLRLTEKVLARGQQVMILLPEINLTPQLESRFRARFDAKLAVFHSGLPEGRRRDAWLSIQRGDAAILLGTRSAVFTPSPSLGLIILDEEHDSSFKQQDGLRFSARDVAIMRARRLGLPIVLGSATPSLESLANVDGGRYHSVSLPKRAGAANPPRFETIDIRAQTLQEGLSSQLIQRMRETLARGEQVLLFVNRRGFAPTLICHQCGWVAPCPDCDARLVIHQKEQRLRCHHCGLETPLLAHCPTCKQSELKPLGLGTERIEEALKALFSDQRIARIDRDSTRHKGTLDRVLDAVHAGRINLLVGTQMIAKGHHFPGVTLVGILDVDAGLYSTDFRAGEKTAQLIIQVAGRAGREEKPGTVLLQTRNPGHPLLKTLIEDGYPAFAAACLKERQAAGLPPFEHQGLVRCDALVSQDAEAFLTHLRDQVHSDSSAVMVLGPVPAPMARRGNRFRWQLLLQAPQRGQLHALMDVMMASAETITLRHRVRWSLDIDPVDLF